MKLRKQWHLLFIVIVKVLFVCKKFDDHSRTNVLCIVKLGKLFFEDAAVAAAMIWGNSYICELKCESLCPCVCDEVRELTVLR